MTEAEVLGAVLKRLNKYPNIWAWRRGVGAHQVGGRWVRYGQPGQADIEGIILMDLPERQGSEDIDADTQEVGVHLEVEVKAPGKKPTPKQIAWLAACASSGAVALWVDSVKMLEDLLAVEFRRRGWS